MKKEREAELEVITKGECSRQDRRLMLCPPQELIEASIKAQLHQVEPIESSKDILCQLEI